jgi:hypothetical protein
LGSGAKAWTAYFDTGGSESDAEGRVLITAGVVATMEKWARFDRAWTRALEEAGVRELHMRELVHSTGEFTGWDEAQRSALLTRLLQETKRGVNKLFVAVVILPAYRELNQRYKLTETIGGPYALAQTAGIGQAWDWLARTKHGEDGVAFAVAAGDNGQDRFLSMATIRRTLPVKVNVCDHDFIMAYCELHVPERNR